LPNFHELLQGALPADGGGPGLARDAAGHAKQPISQPLRLLNRRCLLRQDQECDLKGIFRAVPPRQDPPADTQHHRPMPAQQFAERRFMPL
jgi:hypothetical protein